MTDYTKSTNFATKDSLPSGNPAKIVKGTEINTEFDNIAVSIATKADNSSPSFTGTLTASDLVVTGDTTLGNAATDTVTITADVASNIIPSADSTYTLGDASNYWSHGYMDAATITGNLAIGGDIAVTGNATITGNLTFGNADTDSITLTAEVASNITPDVDNTYDLGTATKEWRNLYVDGTAYVDAIDFNGTAITATGAELNTLDGITANVTELNYTDGVTSNIQTQLDNKQPLSAVLTATTASFTTADETKLDAIEAGATADQTASEILTAVKTVDGAGSGLDADLLDGNEATAFATAAQGTLADSALQSSDIGVSVQGYDATILVDADIGANVLAYDSNLQSFVTTFTLPTTDSTAGYVLKTDGAGALSFVAQADYDESTVAITGGTIDGTVIGGTTPAAGSFTTLDTTGNLTVTGTGEFTSTSAGAETVVATLTNAGSTAGTAVNLRLDPSDSGGIRTADIVASNAGANDITLSFLTSNGSAPVLGLEISNQQNVAIPNGNLTVTGNLGIGASPSQALTIYSGTQTTTALSSFNGATLTTGVAVAAYTNSASFSGQGLVKSVVDNATASGYAIAAINDGTGNAVFIDNNGSGNALYTDGGDVVINEGNLSVNSGGLGTTNGDTLDLLTLDYNSGNQSALEVKAVRDSNGTIWTSSGTRIQQKTDATNQAYIQFNGTDNNYGLSLGAANAESMRIDSSGNVGIGGAPSHPLDVIDNFNGVHVSALRNTSTDTSSSATFQIAAGGRYVNHVVNYNSAYYQEAYSGITSKYTDVDTQYFRNSDGTEIFRKTTVGLSFDAGANNLDTYEEGTWTPSLQFGGATTGITYSTLSASYTRIGDLCHVQAIIILSSKGSATGAAIVTGLPFTNVATIPAQLALYPIALSITDFPSIEIGASTSYFTIQQVTNAGSPTTLTDLQFGGNDHIRVSGTYKVA